MRYLITFFIGCVYSFALNAGMQYDPAKKANTSGAKDSLNIFNNITDIESQLKKTTAEFERNGLSTISPVLPDTIVPQPRVNPVRRTNYLDSLYARRANGTLILPDNRSTENLSRLSLRDTIIINPLYLPVVFTGKILPEDLSFYPPQTGYKYKGLLIAPENTFAPVLRNMRFIDDVRRYYYVHHPERIKMSVFNFDGLPQVDTQKDVVETYDPFKKPIHVEQTVSLQAPSVETVQIERKYWVYSGEHKLQFAQNYFSDNWYKSGTSNLNVNSYQVFRANYKKEKVKFDNTFEWRLSLFTTPDDTVRQYRIGDDLIRYYGSLGVDAFLKKWSYSTNMEVKSQIFNGYPPNSTTLRSAFLSPLYVNAGIGMRYELDKKSEKVRHRRVRWTLDLAPISMNYRYVGNSQVDVKRYGIDEGSKSKLEIGSTITSILKYDITRYITWDSRFKYFTSYKNVMAEFENSLDMSLSQYFSTRLYVHMRYDDGVPMDPEFKHFQINEMISFGLNYKW